VSSLVKFDFKGAAVRTQTEGGLVWFNAQDVAKALGYKNHRDAIKKHCKPKGVANRDSLSSGGIQRKTTWLEAARAAIAKARGKVKTKSEFFDFAADLARTQAAGVAI